ncbi:MAG: citrate lyase subunit alpha [Angelakisella sp.]|nr:citrate lyase subunit alpha [Angelakisella sp.]
MKNAVGRDIPDELLTGGREVFQGNAYRADYQYTKVGPTVRGAVIPTKSKVVENISQALVQCGIKDGMTVSFHHHFRDGDYIVNMVMDKIAEMGVKNITIAASSLGSAHDPVADYITQGIVTGIQTSGIRGKIGEVVSAGKLQTPAILRTHGGRVRAIECGEVHIDIAFIGASSSDEYGNASGKGGKSNCGGLAYSDVDARYADKVVVITDTLVSFPNKPSSISCVDVDYVVVVDQIGNPDKIASAAARITDNPRDLLIAENCAKIMRSTPYFKDGFSFQTGVGGPSIATTLFLKKYMQEQNIRMGWVVGGISTPMVEMLKEGYIQNLADTQDFDVGSVQSLGVTPHHFEITCSEYANPMNKGAFINKLDFVILAALEIDIDFNVNVVTGSDGILRGAPGGHPDTSYGAKCTIIVAPLVRGRIPTVCDSVVTVTTPGESVDILVTEYGTAVNPKRQDLIEALDAAEISHVTIEQLRDKAYSMVGKPEPVQFCDNVVAILEARDGTLLDVVRQIKPYAFD